MLSCIRVENLAIIDQLEVELGPGLNVITGETGAGKSILIDALSLVLGERGRPELVRTGAAEAEVEALFDLSDDPDARARLTASGLLPEADGDDAPAELVVRRVVKSSGRTRAYLNGKLASASELARVVQGLVDISSQHEHHTLVDSATHLGFLDEFGRLAGQREAVREAYRELREAEESLAEHQEAQLERTQREDLLRFALQEIDEVDPRPGEEDALEEERGRLRHAERLSEVTEGAEDRLYGADGSLSEILGRIAEEVREAAELDPSLRARAEELDSAVAQVEETARELGAYARSVTRDERRLAELEERAHRLKRLVRKYGGGAIEGVLDYRADARAELEAFDNAEAEAEALEQRRQACRKRAAKVARALSKERHAIAEDLAQKISAELASLGMGGARVEIQVERLAPRAAKHPARGKSARRRAGAGRPAEDLETGLSVDGARLSETGIDRVEFLIGANPGEPPRPLAKIASGGELSRAMLAIKRVLAGVGRAGLYVFDEVDAGVGGAVAEVIGQKLADVAAHHQVICVTHLAQIAVYASRHYRVHKAVDEGRTKSRIEELDEAARLEEIARMVGGLTITEATRGAAADLLRGARA